MNKLQFAEFKKVKIGDDYWLTDNILVDKKANGIKVIRYFKNRSCSMSCVVQVNQSSYDKVRQSIIRAKQIIAEEYKENNALVSDCDTPVKYYD